VVVLVVVVGRVTREGGMVGRRDREGVAGIEGEGGGGIEQKAPVWMLSIVPRGKRNQSPPPLNWKYPTLPTLATHLMHSPGRVTFYHPHNIEWMKEHPSPLESLKEHPPYPPPPHNHPPTTYPNTGSMKEHPS
jgi:hypothetical protein